MLRLIASLFALILAASATAAPPLPDILDVECSDNDLNCVAADVVASSHSETINLGARAEHRPDEGNRSHCMQENPTGSVSAAQPFHPVPPVTGYRSLSQAEVDLMNEGKAVFNAVGEYLDKLTKYAPKPGEVGVGIVTDGRCVSIAKTEAQTAAMWAIRSITKPSGFA